MASKFWFDQEKDWKFYYDEGKSYLKTCKKLLIKRGPFDNEFIYNLSILAGERLVLGTLLSYDYIPASSSLLGMLKEAEEKFTVDNNLFDGAKYIYKFQPFCSLEVEDFKIPDDSEIKKVVDYFLSIENLCEKNLYSSAMVK